MIISGYLAKDAKAISEQIGKAFSGPRQKHLIKKIAHIINVLESPSKSKLRSAIENIEELCNIIEGNPGIVGDLQRLSRDIEREVPPPKKNRRRHSGSW